MTIREALKHRKSVRAFLKKNVEKEIIVRILDAAMEAAFRKYRGERMEYEYSPLQWREPFRKRRVKCGTQLYAALGIDRKDKERRLQQWMANYHAFNAPVVLFFFVSSDLRKGAFLDYGMFLHSIMLAALDEGLATCAEAALGHFPEVVKNALGYGDDTVLVCGMALGYEDKDAPVNNYRTEREEVESFTRFFE